MTNEEIIKKLKNTLDEKRFKHSEGVSAEAVKMAKLFGADPQKAYIAGILHDCAKGISIDEQIEKCCEYSIELDSFTKACPPVIHAPLGEYIAVHEYGVSDPEILEAIRSHTVGRCKMTLLDKIVYVADMIEPMRDFEGVDELRAVAAEDIDRALIMGLKKSIAFNIKKEKIVHPDTLNCYNDMLMQMAFEI